MLLSFPLGSDERRLLPPAEITQSQENANFLSWAWPHSSLCEVDEMYALQCEEKAQRMSPRKNAVDLRDGFPSRFTTISQSNDRNDALGGAQL